MNLLPIVTYLHTLNDCIEYATFYHSLKKRNFINPFGVAFANTKMQIIYIGLVLLAIADAQRWNITLNSREFEIHKGDVHKVLFNVGAVSSENKIIPNVIATTSDVKVATVTAPSGLESLVGTAMFWNNSVDVKGEYIGKAEITLSIENDTASEKFTVTIIRAERLIDKLFTISVAILVSILYINFGCALDWKICREILKKPIGPLIGSFCQFIGMPLIAFGIGQVIFPNNPEMQIGLFFTGISPSGGASNIWTVLLGGNLQLSIGMTTLGTLAHFGTMPIWIFTLGKFIFDKGNLGVPYNRVATSAMGLIIPLALGVLIQYKLPKVSCWMVRIMKPFSIILILFIVIFAIVTNLYLFELFSWQIIVAGIALPWLGFILGYIMMVIFRQPQKDIRAIAIETGIENTGISIFLLRFCLKQPAADLTTVIPVSCAIMTPVPLMIIWAVKIILDRRKKRVAKSVDELQVNMNEPIVKQLDISTIPA